MMPLCPEPMAVKVLDAESFSSEIAWRCCVLSSYHTRLLSIL